MRRFVVFFAIFSSTLGIFGSVLNLKPKQHVNSVGLGDRFGGIGTHSDESDHFKLLAADGDSLLVGARNAVYNLSLSSLVVNHKIDWKPPSDSIEECIMKGKSKTECQNYIRVLARKSAGVQLVCGTHAFAPKCREYTTDGVGQVRMTRQFDGLGISPYDPRHNSSALYLPETKQLYAATVTDFVGNDALIYRKNVDEDSRSSMIRTQRDDIRVLDSPNFVASFAYKEHIYFWFRELASEAVDNNEEMQVYARVARVCKSDKGGARPSNERWTSYLKARLNCSLPSQTSPFYFNELKAVSEPIAAGNDHTVYGVFSTPQSDIRMSAVCAFSMNRIRDEFENGQFKHQKSAQSIWSPISRNDQPRQRPGRCVTDSTKLPEAAVSFILRNPLMYRAIQPIGPPLLIEAVERAELTQITVLPRVNSVNGHKYDVLFIGTSDGKVLKVVEIDGNATLIQSSQIFARTVSIVNLLTDTNNIVIVSSDEIASLPVQNCAQQTSCAKCVQLQDPHCAWDSQIARCVHRSDWHGGHFIQNMVFGQSEQCPEGIVETLEETDSHLLQSEAILTSSSSSDQLKQHTTVTLVLAVLIASIVSLIFGAFIGARITQWATSSDQHRSASSTSGSDYDSFGRARLTRHDSLTTATKIDHTYAPPSKTSIDATSMILSMNATHPMSMSQHGSGVNTPSRDKNAIVTSINQNTLPRDYKVKKVYL